MYISENKMIIWKLSESPSFSDYQFRRILPIVWICFRRLRLCRNLRQCLWARDRQCIWAGDNVYLPETIVSEPMAVSLSLRRCLWAWDNVFELETIILWARVNACIAQDLCYYLCVPYNLPGLWWNRSLYFRGGEFEVQEERTDSTLNTTLLSAGYWGNLKLGTPKASGWSTPHWSQNCAVHHL